jgi:hypothetical protein
MSSEGIKPDHGPISEIPPEPGPRGSPTSFPTSVVLIPDLVSGPRWTVAAIAYVVALVGIVPAGVVVADRAGYHIKPAFPLGAGLSLLLFLAGIFVTAQGRPTRERTGRLSLSVCWWCTGR